MHDEAFKGVLWQRRHAWALAASFLCLMTGACTHCWDDVIPDRDGAWPLMRALGASGAACTPGMPRQHALLLSDAPHKQGRVPRHPEHA